MKQQGRTLVVVIAKMAMQDLQDTAVINSNVTTVTGSITKKVFENWRSLVLRQGILDVVALLSMFPALSSGNTYPKHIDPHKSLLNSSVPSILCASESLLPKSLLSLGFHDQCSV